MFKRRSKQAVSPELQVAVNVLKKNGYAVGLASVEPDWSYLGHGWWQVVLGRSGYRNGGSGFRRGESTRCTDVTA